MGADLTTKLGTAQTVAANEALLIAGLRQHELTAAAEKLSRQLETQIAAREKTTEALRITEERSRSLLLILTDVPWICDAVGAFVTLQPAWASYTGQSWEEMRDFGWTNALHPDDRERIMGVWAEARQPPHVYQAEQRVWCAMRREWRHFSVRATPIRDRLGGIREWVGACTEVHERKLVEEALRESVKKYHNLFDSIDEGFCVIEKLEGEVGAPPDFRYVEANPAFTVQSGVGDVVGKTIRQMFPGVTEQWYETYDNILATGESLRFERVLDANGRILELYAFRVEDDSHRRLAVIFKDITARKQVEALLTEAKAMAEKANSAKSDFLSSMSHELRTPLNAILGFAQLMESGSPPPTPSQNRSIERIKKAGWYLLELINEILDLTLIESGKMTLSHEPVPLATVMVECRAMIESQAQRRGIDITFPRFVSPIFLMADRTRVEQVLINLLFNAIKYNKPGGTVAMEYTLMPQGSIRINVTDTGTGLSPEQLQQLFQPFNRLGKEATAEEGTGIGLVVSKRLVELMGGTIGAESTVGVGSTFWIELGGTAARELTAPKADHATQAPPLAQAVVPHVASPRTVLYVEDNPSNLALVEELIARRSDLRLLCAVDGTLGIEAARVHQPQVILMDINLPGISGIDAMKILRNDPATAHIPIIAVSANAIPRDISRGLKAGFFDYITKPIKVKEFMDALDVALVFSQSALDRANKNPTA